MMPPILFLVVTLSSAPAPHSAVATASRDTIRIHHETQRDLTGDGIPEHLFVEAVGVDWKEMTVRLEIRADLDTLMYFDEWDTKDYFYAPLTYDPNTPEGSERLVTSRLREVFSGASFVEGLDTRTGRTRIMPRIIRDDMVEQLWRERYGKTLRDRIFQRPGFSQYRDEFLPLISNQRVEALASELENSLLFVYSNGHDSNVYIAWSHSERRFVTVRAT